MLTTTAATTSMVNPCCPSASDRVRDCKRREQIHLGRRLFEGKWRELLLDLDKLAQHKYREVRNHARTVKALLVKVNVIRLAAITHADILLNEAPSVTIPEENDIQAQRWEEIADHCLFEQVAYETALTCNIESEAWIGIVRQDGHTCLTLLDGMECFPIGPMGHDGQPTIVDRRWIIKRKDASGREKCYLRVERHSAPGGVGRIENFAYAVDSAFAYHIPEKAKAIDLKSIFAEAAPEPVAFTGVDRPLIFRFANRTLRREPCPDLTKDDIDLVDQLAATTSQIARIAAKHADPKMRVPEGLKDDQGRIDVESLEAFEDPDKQGEYLTWDSKMVDVLSLLTNVINWLLMVLEISPSLVGIKAGAAPESYQKLFLEATNTMKRANRIKSSWRPLWERVLTTLLRFDAAGDFAGYPVAPVSVVLRPGLPRTQGDIIDEYGRMRSFDLIDEVTALEEIHGVEKAEGIYQRLVEQRKARTEALIGSTFTPAEPLTTEGTENTETGTRPVEGADEIDPETGEPKEVAPAVVTTERVLNGAQIQAATIIVRNVVDGVMPRDAGIGQLVTLFNLTVEQAEQIMGSAGKGFVPNVPAQEAVPA